MAFIIGKLKCYFCNNSNGLLHSVPQYGIYGRAGKRLFYHDQCLEMIEIEPEKFGHIMIDKALYINELKKRSLEFNSKLTINFKEKIDKLNKNHFERMMPKNY